VGQLKQVITLKSKRELDIMRDASRIVGEILLELKEQCAPGVTTQALDRMAEDLTRKKGAQPAFKGYRGFPRTLCTSVNEEVVHGIPGDRELQDGDIIGLDFGVILGGYYGDSAVTVPIGNVSPEIAKLLRVTEESLYLGIEQMVSGNHLADISRAIQTHAEGHGYSLVREFGGHGIGRRLHEDPMVLNYVVNGRGIKLKPGLVLAIEPMVNVGTERVRILQDGWTVVTQDGQPSAHFEHTIAITDNGPEILSRVA
jgi:methionyl aminopeptidase